MVVRLKLIDLDLALNQQALGAEIVARMERQGPEMRHGKVSASWDEGTLKVSVEVGDSEADVACKRVLLSLAWAQLGIYDGFKFMKPITKGQVAFDPPCPPII